MWRLIYIFLFIQSFIATGQTITSQEYIKTYKELAVQEMIRTGIPASITLAQGMLESGNGNSSLAVKGNNHFGIKCHDWDGPKIHHDDDHKNECFRKYRSVYQSYIDHSDFLANTSRYSFLFELGPTNYKAWARGLKKAGYATAHDYDRKLIDLIETYELYLYDQEGKMKNLNRTGTENMVSSTSNHTIKIKNNIKYIIAKEGDTYLSLTSEYDMMRWQIGRYNDISQNAKIKAGDIIYIQPKRKKAEHGEKFHIVKEGETMFSISQKYGIKMSELYKKNLMLEGTQPNTGEKIYLRKKKKGEMPVEVELPDNDQHQMEFIFE